MNTKLPDNILILLRRVRPEPVRVDAESPSKSKLQLVIDDGPEAGLLLATFNDPLDAELVEALWNWARKQQD